MFSDAFCGVLELVGNLILLAAQIYGCANPPRPIAAASASSECASAYPRVRGGVASRLGSDQEHRCSSSASGGSPGSLELGEGGAKAWSGVAAWSSQY